MTLKESLETMCRRCINHEQCLGTGCAPKNELDELIKSKVLDNREYELREPYPNKYKHVVDNGFDMLECPECKCRIQSAQFSYAVGNLGYRFCPYCGTDVRKPDQMTFDDILGGI